LEETTDPVLVAKQPLLLTLKEAGDSLRISRPKLYELMAAGQLRSVKIGGSRRIPTAALAEFVAALESDEPVRT
jgi:excisionase family DNA binding protein